MSDRVIYLFVVIVCFFTVLLIIFAYLISKKIVENRRKKEVDVYKQLYQPLLFRYLISDIDDVPPPSLPLQFVAVMELLDHFVYVLGTEDVKKRAMQLAERDFAQYLRAELRHRRLGRRMNALFFIEDFELRAFLPELEGMYWSSKRTIVEKKQLLKMFARFQLESLYEYIQAVAKELTQFDYRLTFTQLTEERFTALLEQFTEWNEQMQYALIDVIGITKNIRYVPFLRTLLTSEKSEYRIRALKALAEIGAPLEAEQLARHLHSAIWPERLMALKLCARSRSAEVVERVKELMKDSVFAVRSQAAEALLHMPNGVQHLQDVAETSDDRYARDMAIEWLERGREDD